MTPRPGPGPGSLSPRPRARRGDGERLREDILDAADALLVELGDEDAVSMRAIAGRVGVGPGALYLHFADKPELLFAVCERHFAALDAALGAAEAEANDPLDALRRRGRAYVDFALAEPEHYRILFMGRPGAAPEAWSAERMASSAAFGNQVRSVRRGMDTGVLPPGDAVLVAVGLWTSVHGVASLLLAKPDFPWPDVDTLVDHVLQVQAAGLRAPPVNPGDQSDSPPGWACT